MSRPDNIILVGHSYGGTVITGVMDELPERIAYVFFLDAFVPDDGMSHIEAARNAAFDPDDPMPGLPIVDGQVFLPWMDLETYEDTPYPKDVPQSLRSLIQPVSFTNEQALRLPVTYVAFGTEELRENGSGIHPANRQRARERGWDVQLFVSDHNPQDSQPEALVELLLSELGD